MADKKITKNQKFEMLLNIKEVKDNEMLVEFIEHEIELNSKKRGTSKAMTELNAKITEMVVNALEKLGKPATVTQILENEDLKEFTYKETENAKEVKKLTNQKVNSILQNLITDKRVVNTKEKKKSYYALVVED